MIELISISFIVISLSIVLKLKSNFVYSILVFHILIDILTGLVDPGEQASNVYLAFGRALVVLIFLFIIYEKLLTNFYKEFKSVLVFLLFLILLIPLSTNIITSFSGVLKIIITYSMLPVGYILINTYEKLKKINYSVYYIVILIVLNFIIANLLGLGQTSYSANVNFYAGGFHVGALNTLAVCIILSPLVFISLNTNQTKLYLIFITLLIIFLVLSMKRAPIAASIIGFIVFFIFSKSKGQYLKGIVGLTILLIITLPIYSELLYKQLNARERQLQIDVIEEESRFLEIVSVTNEILYSNDIKTFLIGKEIFNSVGNYADGIFGVRALHTDIATILHGSGILGMLLFVYIYFSLLLKFIKLKKNSLSTFTNSLKYKKMFMTLKPTFLALAIVTVLISVSEGLMAVSYRSMLFLYVGSILGILSNNKREKCVE